VPMPASTTVAKLNATAGAPGRTATSSIEALLYELRADLSCLTDPGTQGRLRSCDNEAVRTITGALRSWKAQNSLGRRTWTEDDIKAPCSAGASSRKWDAAAANKKPAPSGRGQLLRCDIFSSG
jgi:hypothetical protein